MLRLCVHSLPRYQVGKEAALFDQRVVAAVLHDLPAVEHQNAVAVADLEIQPLGKAALFRTGKLDLPDAGDHKVSRIS